MSRVQCFGICRDGKEAQLAAISDGFGCEARICSLGAAVQSLIIAGAGDKRTDVVLGYDSVQEYEESDGCLGGTMGRCTNRIEDALIKNLDGRCVALSENRKGFHMHGGFVGFHKKLWHLSVSDEAVLLSLDSPDGDEGYPGKLHAEVKYSWSGPGEFRIDYDCVSDKCTVINLTNHNYYNLNGHSSGSIGGHSLKIDSRLYAALNEKGFCSGALLSTENTPLDFSDFHSLGSRIDSDFDTLKKTSGYDQSYAISGNISEPAAVLRSDDGSLSMSLYTDLPALGLYTANYLSPRHGKCGAFYGPREAVCLEPQFIPNAANHPELENCPVFKAGEHYHHSIVLRFSASEAAQSNEKGGDIIA